MDCLESSPQNVICVVKLLLVQALRLGVTRCNTLQDVLAGAAARADRMIVWDFPNRPVLPAIANGIHLDLDQPAMASQMNRNLQHLELAARVLDCNSSNRFLYHAFRDTARLKQAVTCVSEEVSALPAHHNLATMARSVTRRHYIDSVQEPIYNLRAT